MVVARVIMVTGDGSCLKWGLLGCLYDTCGYREVMSESEARCDEIVEGGRRREKKFQVREGWNESDTVWG